MKNLFYVAIAVLMFSSCQQQKIGFIDNGTVINDYEEKKEIEAKFQERNEVFKKKYDSVVNALQFEAQKVQVRAKRSSQAKAQEMIASIVSHQVDKEFIIQMIKKWDVHETGKQNVRSQTLHHSFASNKCEK